MQDPEDDLPPGRRPSLLTVAGAYAALTGLAVVTLDGKLRLAVLVLFAGLAVKTWIAWKQRDQ
ncbi:MAG: hypothetical protein IPM24_19855 [Bryobacterales bacterium]|nr:hypothetical protein [Bryobacterales bacterium]